MKIRWHPIQMVAILLFAATMIGQTVATEGQRSCKEHIGELENDSSEADELENVSYEISTLDGLLREIHVRHNFKVSDVKLNMCISECR